VIAHGFQDLNGGLRTAKVVVQVGNKGVGRGRYLDLTGECAGTVMQVTIEMPVSTSRGDQAILSQLTVNLAPRAGFA